MDLLSVVSFAIGVGVAVAVVVTVSAVAAVLVVLPSTVTDRLTLISGGVLRRIGTGPRRGLTFGKTSADAFFRLRLCVVSEVSLSLRSREAA